MRPHLHHEISFYIELVHPHMPSKITKNGSRFCMNKKNLQFLKLKGIEHTKIKISQNVSGLPNKYLLKP
jgi:hypothetical protein